MHGSADAPLHIECTRSRYRLHKNEGLQLLCRWAEERTG